MKESKAYASLFDDDDYENEEDNALDAELQVRSFTAYSVTEVCASEYKLYRLRVMLHATFIE